MWVVGGVCGGVEVNALLYYGGKKGGGTVVGGGIDRVYLHEMRWRVELNDFWRC